MRLTTGQLKKIIREEVSRTLREMRGEGLGWDPQGTVDKALALSKQTPLPVELLEDTIEQLNGPAFTEVLEATPDPDAALDDRDALVMALQYLLGARSPAAAKNAQSRVSAAAMNLSTSLEP